MGYEATEVQSGLEHLTGFFPTNRGGRTLVVHGYQYRLEKRSANRTSWKCKVFGCRARCSTNTYDQIVNKSKIGEHKHPIDWRILQEQFPDEVKPDLYDSVIDHTAFDMSALDNTAMEDAGMDSPGE